MWNCIAQGFANHINTNPEKYRSLLGIQHEGKKDINVRNDSLVRGSKSNDWQSVFGFSIIFCYLTVQVFFPRGFCKMLGKKPMI